MGVHFATPVPNPALDRVNPPSCDASMGTLDPGTSGFLPEAGGGPCVSRKARSVSCNLQWGEEI